ncbi:phage protein Gp27 family protein [Rhodopseudomonas sp. AAP120]|uniref:phage protein Gp27 family protein n=1 Tax=Rhodopseudomonas sp. AAP120 TaxID=1523430 RepID=UPI0006B9A97C|nr:phage protein Gp27 family protein [Rhodopseudomonas sp. AAP120]
MANRPSSIDRLPEEVRDLIGRLRDRGCTIDEIMRKLGELDLDKEELPSRSAIGRHLKKADEVAERIRRQRQVAEVIVRRLGESDPDKTTRMNIELMHNVLFEIATRTAADGESVTFDPMEAMLLAKALDHLGKASKDDVARTVAIEKRAAEKAKAEALAKTAKAIDDAADSAGQLDGAALLKKIREDIYGITT